MRHSFPAFTLIIASLYYGPSAWGGEYHASDTQAQHLTALFAEIQQETDDSSNELKTPLFQTSFATTSLPIQINTSRLRDRFPESASPRSSGIHATTTWLKGAFVTDTEVASSHGGPGWLQGTIPGDTRRDASNRMFRLSLTREHERLRYGFTYRNAGPSYMSAPDQDFREIWGEWKTGYATLRTAAGKIWNNVAGNQARPQIENAYERIGLLLARSSWPELSLNYSHNSQKSSDEPFGVAPLDIQSDILESSLAYQKPLWSVRLTSSYILSHDLYLGGAERTARRQLLSASFRPFKSLTISPMLGFTEEKQDWSGIQIDSPSASLALNYEQSRNLRLSATGTYANSRSNNGLVDNENVGGRGIVTWDVQQMDACKALIAVEAGYSRLVNRANPSAEVEDILGMVRVVLAAL